MGKVLVVRSREERRDFKQKFQKTSGEKKTKKRDMWDVNKRLKSGGSFMKCK